MFLNSLRISIEAGGEWNHGSVVKQTNPNLTDISTASCVMLRVLLRDSCDITITHTSSVRDISYLFDRAHFKSSMKAACSMITIYDYFDTLENYPWAMKSTHLTPKSLDDILHGYTIAHPHE